jgi:penicillin-binding protein 1C
MREAMVQRTNPEAAWLISDILADPQARVTTFGLDSALRLPFWAAVKTGTSKGLRDNWCIGYTDRYTVAVWVGNLEGDPMRAVSGTSGAAPIWREIMLGLHQQEPGRPMQMPRGVEARQVRFSSGLEAARRDYFMRGTGQTEMGLAPLAARRPRITNPVSGAVFALDPDIPKRQQRMAVLVNGDVAGHRLILDKRDIGGAGDQPLILTAPGVHTLVLSDAEGRQVDRVRFTMR